MCLNINILCFFVVSGGGAGFSLLQDTPSIAKVRSAQVEVVSIPRGTQNTTFMNLWKMLY